jgi:hypothetical protein
VCGGGAQERDALKEGLQGAQEMCEQLELQRDELDLARQVAVQQLADTEERLASTQVGGRPLGPWGGAGYLLGWAGGVWSIGEPGCGSCAHVQSMNVLMYSPSAAGQFAQCYATHGPPSVPTTEMLH